MSFDIFFQTCRYTGQTKTVKNPFTGQDVVSTESEPLTAAEVKAVREVLARYRPSDPLDDDVRVRMPDGSEAEVFGKNLESSCMVALRGLTPALSQFLFELLQAGNWVMLPAMDDDVSITTAPDRVAGLPDDFPRLVECRSAQELHQLLTGGVQAWERYRDQVTRKQ